jgi:hypothetical protein
MYCAHCGQRLRLGAPACPSCGHVYRDGYLPLHHWQLHPGRNKSCTPIFCCSSSPSRSLPLSFSLSLPVLTRSHRCCLSFCCRFYCDGRFVSSHQTGVRLLNWTIFLATLAAFLAVDAPYLWNNVSPATVLVPVLLALVAASNLLMVSLTDPGIIPRGCEPECGPENEDRPTYVSSRPAPALGPLAGPGPDVFPQAQDH